MINWLIIFAGAGLAANIAYHNGQRAADGALISRQATVIEQITTADERMLRSRTNFGRPGVTQAEVDVIVMVARHYGMDELFLYAGRRVENGGRGLYYGANMIDPDIRERYPMTPLAWQPAMFAKTWNKHLNRLAQKDLAIRNRVLTTLSNQWNVDPEKWALEVATHLARAQGADGLAVTEPPKTPVPKARVGNKGVNPKAKRSGHKAPRTSRKETQ